MRLCCVGASKALDDLETVLNSTHLTELLRRNDPKEAKEFAALTPSLCFGPDFDSFLGTNSASLLRMWRQMNDPSPQLVQCIWSATEFHYRPSAVSMFEVAVAEHHFGAAQSVLLAFSGSSSPNKTAFSNLLNRRDETGDTLYVHSFSHKPSLQHST